MPTTTFCGCTVISDVAIKVEGLTKIYRLYDDPVDRLKEALHPFRKKYHRDFYALNDVNFEINKGETVGIIGKNGAGKSTLLKILTGILSPTQGRLSVNGRVLALLELGTGFSPELSGIENVYFNGTLLGASREEMDQKLDAILEFADIGDFVHQPVKTYSSGMTVRLAFAVIANMDPEVLIVDEALSVGDAFFVQKCMRFLRKFIEDGTLLFVSHDTGAVLNLCSRVIWLNKGVILADGNPKKISEAYLTNLYEEQQGVSVSVSDSEVEPFCEYDDFTDMRQKFISCTQYRNDIELFSFRPDAESFGKGSTKIISVQLLDMSGNLLSWIVGGESVKLHVLCEAIAEINSPIVGFLINDRLGQHLFGDNTFNFTQFEPLHILPNQRFAASFEFKMPILPIGDYSITVAIAEGTQHEHVQHQWIHDAVLFKSHSSSVSTGLVGVPMTSISVEVL